MKTPTIKNIRLKTAKTWFCGLVFAIVSAWVMVLYVHGPLNGHFNKHLMQARSWGVPAELKAHGISPLYLDSQNKGWDGQFYFYMANDLLARKDTAQHMDADAYRYQRIGIPLLAKTVSIVLGQDWVSPAVYYGTQAFLIFLATVLAAGFFAGKGLSPFWILPWCLAAGTQITLLNGLPDGGADALLIVALICFYRKNYVLYAISCALACLAREAYVLFPAVLFAVYAWTWLKKPAQRLRFYQYFCLVFPGLVFVAWQAFIRLRFDHTPGEQSAAVLGAPLVRAIELLLAGLRGHYPGMPEGQISVLSGIGILLFLLVMVATVHAALKVRVSRPMIQEDLLAVAVKSFVLILSALYFCFGDTVMWNFTGYMKAADLLIFMVPFMVAISPVRWRLWPAAVLFSVVTVFFGWQALALRVLQPSIVYNLDVNCGEVVFQPNGECKEKFVWLGRELPSLSGRIDGDNREAHAPQDGPNILTFGPYIDLPKGHYRISLSYSGSGESLGYMDIIALSGQGGSKVFGKFDLQAQRNGSFSTDFAVTDELLKSVEIRVWHGQGALSVHALSVEKE